MNFAQAQGHSETLCPKVFQLIEMLGLFAGRPLQPGKKSGPFGGRLYHLQWSSWLSAGAKP
jgi:hypothetical protein